MKEIVIKNPENWARCPICNVIWNITTEFLGGSGYFRWEVEDCDLPPGKLPERLCPDHVEEIVVDGRKKGIKRTLYQDQLNEMKLNGLHCPVCKGKDLRSQGFLLDPQPKLQEFCLKCNQCHALIYRGKQYIGDEEDLDEVGELVHVFYREDLQTKKELNEARNTICRIIKSKEARSKILCE
ncbi:MAG TPA: hypothetical protein VMV04_16640 [Thermodesulfobacteriota bacterium]|nr:hypothetical protein [Thermodesulfobacteriota bacterium]